MSRACRGGAHRTGRGRGCRGRPAGPPSCCPRPLCHGRRRGTPKQRKDGLPTPTHRGHRHSTLPPLPTLVAAEPQRQRPKHPRPGWPPTLAPIRQPPPRPPQLPLAPPPPRLDRESPHAAARACPPKHKCRLPPSSRPHGGARRTGVSAHPPATAPPPPGARSTTKRQGR
ncbi:hypothetical protein BU14_0522s0004 [Porphyra umbilicalis]|uniref:Uncharacterized protein n=1 Tax=Porphyra umbilicalis TaxID=2786 RepID=A0A1X6NSH6_PORUM|nr:hypothetical protein BU14_0522s0004 [Porphyra umbilicalis]|eukprot:OSX71552.1 hypothetical protein BU14_0522s0004 [Porphyra umbilicalis]